MSRRAHNEGSIYKRRDGRWVGVQNLGWEAGRRRRKYVYGRTQREVVAKLKALSAAPEVADPEPPEAEPGSVRTPATASDPLGSAPCHTSIVVPYG